LFYQQTGTKSRRSVFTHNKLRGASPLDQSMTKADDQNR